MDRRTFIKALSAVTASAAGAPAWSQGAYPAKPIRIVCGSTPGALLDMATRLYAEKMATVLGQPFVVENVAGASSLLAARNVARAHPDGYTLLTAANTLTTIPHLNPANAVYQTKDFTPVGEMARSPSVLVVSASSPYRSVQDIVEAAKSSPGLVTFASGGHGTVSHLPTELFAAQAGIELTHVPYKGVAAAVADLSSGRVDFMISTPTSVAELATAGHLRMLAITSTERSSKYPDIPSFAELGLPDAIFEVWVAMFAPANLPPGIREQLGQAMEVARADAGIRQTLSDFGQHISDVRTPTQFGEFFQAEEEKYLRLIHSLKS